MPVSQSDVDMARKSMIQSGILFLKVVFGTNAASGLAYFAFLGSIIVEGEYRCGAEIINAPLICFAVGVLFAIFAIFSTSTANTYASLQAMLLHKTNYDRASDAEMRQKRWLTLAILTSFGSLVCFIIGIVTIIKLVDHVVHPCVG